MSTTMTPTRPRRRSQQPRVSVRALDTDAGRDHEYDLLTAALIGMTIGAGLTFLMRRGPSGKRPVSPLLDGVGTGATWAGRTAARLGKRGARWAADRAEEAWDKVPTDEIGESVKDYIGRAREAIDEAVDAELHQLQRAMRRQRKRLGL